METAKRIHEQILGQKEFRISSATEFTWDTLYIITPYSSSRELMRKDSTIQLGSVAAKKIDLSFRDDAVALVFIHKKRTVAYCIYLRKWGDFTNFTSFLNPISNSNDCCVTNIETNEIHHCLY
ncbi:MAG: hypothetical protein LBK47_01205 [Prevotellaceae bacterium]|jgi:hypothetical protein|nr:hypothetical protein [Prevotellaceae bacterium]